MDYSGIGTFLRGKKISQNEELAVATKFSFVMEREGIKQTQTTAAADWSPIFGGISVTVSEQIEELTKGFRERGRSK